MSESNNSTYSFGSFLPIPTSLFSKSIIANETDIFLPPLNQTSNTSSTESTTSTPDSQQSSSSLPTIPPDPIIPSLQDHIISTSKYSHRNLIITKAHMTYNPQFTLDFKPPEGSYLIASPSSHNSPYLRGTLVVPDSTDIPQLNQSLITAAKSQYNTYHHSFPTILHCATAEQAGIKNRFTYEYWFHHKLFGPLLRTPRGFEQAVVDSIPKNLPHNTLLQRWQNAALLSSSLNPALFTQPRYPREYPLHISSLHSTLLPTLNQIADTESKGVFINPIHQPLSTTKDDSKSPLFALNVPTVILSQYNSIPEQQMTKIAPLLFTALLGLAFIHRKTAFPRHELHQYLSKPELSPLPLQKSIAQSLGYLSRFNSVTKSVALLPLLEIPMISLCLLPLWGNISTQLPNSMIPYHGIGDHIKIMTQSDYKLQYLRQYQAYYNFTSVKELYNDENTNITHINQQPSPNDIKTSSIDEPTLTDLTTATTHIDHAQPLSSLTTTTTTTDPSSTTTTSSSTTSPDTSTTTTKPTTTTPTSPKLSPSKQTFPSFPGLSREQFEEQLTNIDKQVQSDSTPKLNPNIGLFTLFNSILLRLQNLSPYDSTPFINERLDDAKYTNESSLLQGNLQLPTISSTAPNITPWRQATNVERIIVGSVVTLIVARIAIGRQYRFKSRLSSNPNSIFSTLFNRIIPNKQSINTPSSSSSTTTSTSFTRTRFLLPTFYPPFRFSRLHLPPTVTSPLDHPTALKHAKNAVYDESKHIFTSSVQYSQNYVDRSFTQGEAMIKDLLQQFTRPSLFRITLLTLALTLNNGQFSTEEFIYDNVNDPHSCHYTYDLNAARPKSKNDTNQSSSTTTTTTSSPSSINQTTNSTTTTSDSTPITPPQPITSLYTNPSEPFNFSNQQSKPSTLTECAHTLFTNSNSTPSLLTLATGLYLLSMISQIQNIINVGLKDMGPTGNSPINQIPNELSRLVSDQKHSHPLNSSLQQDKVLPTPKKMAKLLEPIFDSVKTNHINKVPFSPLTIYSFAALSTFVALRFVLYPTSDFIRGNNNGPHPFSETFLQSDISTDALEDEVKPILNTLRHNGIQGLFITPQTPNTIHPNIHQISHHHHPINPTSHSIDTTIIVSPPVSELTPQRQPQQQPQQPQEALTPITTTSEHTSPDIVCCSDAQHQLDAQNTNQIPVTLLQIGYKRETSYIQAITRDLDSWIKPIRSWFNSIKNRPRGGGGGGDEGSGGDE